MKLRLLHNCSILGLLALMPAVSYADGLNNSLDDHLSPRAEVSVKGGTERSILTTEFWAPLAQSSGKVFYGDLRLMGDNDDNREGNLGFGYRQISEATNSVVGGHLWIDRRRTDNNNTFHQVTIGAESLGNVIDLRANGYIALNGTKSSATPNLGSTTPYLAGTGVYIDTTGRVTETAQHGADAEIGYRLPVLQRYADAIRIYGGGYDFFGNGTDNLIGYRVRTSAQINSAISIGARFQHDNQRGDQGFLEATLRFPFSAKKLYQQKGLYGRLDESPERDVDIVTSSKKTSGLMTPLTNTFGTAQRILYVDNSTTNGDGSKEHPFNNLVSAQAALQANDILYIARGNGTTTGMDQGITIDKQGVQLVGSGSNLTIDGYTFINANTAPLITNSQAGTDEYHGNGILVTAGDVSISGVNVSGTLRNGITAIASGSGVNWNSFSLTNSTVSNNVWSGFILRALDGASVGTVTMDGNTAIANATRSGFVVVTGTGGIVDTAIIRNTVSIGNKGQFARGVLFQTNDAGSSINHITTSGLTVLNNGGNGVAYIAGDAATINSVTASNITSTGNGADGGTAYGAGVYVQAYNPGSKVSNVTLDNISSDNNLAFGIHVHALFGGTIDGITVTNTNVNNSTSNGFRIESYGTNSLINNITLDHVNSSNNQSHGLIATAQAGGVMSNVMLSNIITNNNRTFGTAVSVVTGTLNNVTLTNVSSSGNVTNGIQIESLTSGSVNNVTVSNSTTKGNFNSGIFVNTSGTAVFTGVSLYNNNITGNALNGVYVNKATSGGISVDLGGGASGGVGGNRIFSNTGTEIRIDGGYALQAQNNYWGGADLSGGEKTLNGGSTVTTTGFLTVDPRP